MVQRGNPQIILVDFLSCVGAVEGLRSLRQPEYSEYSTTEDTPIDLGDKTVVRAQGNGDAEVEGERK